MQKIFSAFVGLLCLCLIVANSQAQTYTSGHLTVIFSSAASHDSTTCGSNFNVLFTVTVDSSFAGDTVMLVDTNFAHLDGMGINSLGVSPWTFTLTADNQQRTDFSLSPGSVVTFNSLVYKLVHSTDTVKYLQKTDTLIVTNPCWYDYVSGNLFADNNNNCIFDSGDVGLSNIEIDLTDYLSSPVGVIFQPISSTGAAYTYPIQKSWMTSYTVSLPSWLSFVLPYSTCFSGPYTFTTLPQTGVDFPLQCTNLVDVQAGALGPADVRLLKPFILSPYVSNFGCDTVSGLLTLIKDSRTTYDPTMSTNPADYVSGDTLIWNYAGLSNLSVGAYWNSFVSSIYLTPDSTLSVGDSLCFLAYTGVPASDVNPTNNQSSFCIPLVYSYDPNEKEVSPKGVGPEGFIPSGPDTLTYTLHFQNTGTDYAYDIKVLDTLDSHINASSLRILATSATMYPKWAAPGVIEFDFNNIFLPDSGMNMAGSQGEVRFKVALNTGLSEGTQIKNTGYIYFDTNPAVVTNTTLNTIQTPTQTNQITARKQVMVFPNPAHDFVTIENLGAGTISVCDLNGQTLMTTPCTGDKAVIDVSTLPAGVYMLRATDQHATTTRKITKL
jgi:uncharacterized repeat protein (TIGR01451 family)